MHFVASAGREFRLALRRPVLIRLHFCNDHLDSLHFRKHPDSSPRGYAFFDALRPLFCRFGLLMIIHFCFNFILF
jgi:hypothetical protein